jgi:hypothetical protein
VLQVLQYSAVRSKRQFLSGLVALRAKHSVNVASFESRRV